VDEIVGIAENGEGDDDGAEPPGRQFRAAGRRTHGLAVVAIESMGFGHRRDPLTLERGRQTACEPVSGAALLLGETMLGWRVWDVMRAIDYIETRPDLDASRVGCVGISGGGTCALFTAALDSRIRCTYLSGYLNTFRASIMSIAHCVDNYVPGILNWAEMYDVAGLIAPRPLFSEAGAYDPIFPVAASQESFAWSRRSTRSWGPRTSCSRRSSRAATVSTVDSAGRSSSTRWRSALLEGGRRSP
jgi:hypothetical protein